MNDFTMSPHATKPVVISYIRFSTLEQEQGNSTERQTNYAKDYANKHGLTLDESLTIRDRGLSAYHQKHIEKGGFGVFLKAIEDGLVPIGSTLIVESLDRMSRAEPIVAQAILSQIIMSGIIVITAADNKIYSRENAKKDPSILIMSLIIMIRAWEESEMKSKRIKKQIIDACNKWIDNNARGFIIRNGVDPFWVQPNKDKTGFEFHSGGEAQVKRVIELYYQGHGLHKIYNILIKEYGEQGLDLIAKGSSLYGRTVKSRALVGEKTLHVNGQKFVLKDYYPAILSEVEFAQLQMYATERAKPISGRKYINIFTGMGVTRCGYCGSTIISKVKSKNFKQLNDIPSQWKRIECDGARRVQNKVCDMNNSMSLDYIENAIMQFCKNSFNLGRLSQDDSEESKLKKQIIEHQNKQDAIKAELANLLDMLKKVDKSVQPAIILQQMVDMEGEIKTIDEKIAKLNYQATAISQKTDGSVFQRWEAIADSLAPNETEKRLLVRQLVKDTFKSIDIYMRGINGKHTTGIDAKINKLICTELGGVPEKCADIVFTFKNNQSRIVRIRRFNGEFVNGIKYKGQ